MLFSEGEMHGINESKAGSSVTFGLFLVLVQLLLLLFVFQGTGFAASVVLDWDASTDADLAGYRLYYQANSSALPFSGSGAVEGAAPIDSGIVTTATINGLDPNNTYYFAITAYNSAGEESVYSNIVEIAESAAPVVTVTSSANPSVPGTVSIAATATDNVAVTKVQFFVNGVQVAETAATPYRFSWDTSALAGGDYAISAKAFDAVGNVGDSDIVTVAVAGDTTAPTVSLAGAAAGSTVSGVVALSAWADDDVEVARVDLVIDGTPVLSGNQSAVSYQWNTAAEANGSHILSAVAYDAAGNVGQSAQVEVTVLNDFMAPVVAAFTMPATINSTQIPVSSFACTDNVGVTGYWISESATPPSAFDSGWSAAAPTSFAFAGTGLRTAYAWAKDGAGHVSAASSATVLIDTILPVIRSLSLASGSASVTIKVAASDNVGITRMELYADGALQLQTATDNFTYVWTAGLKKSQSITVKVYDAAGNVRSQTFRVSKI